jgi:UDP-N-acetylglucosamine 1-carboxyvinyltransferase
VQAHKVRKRVGRRIAELRIQGGLTQADFSEEVGVGLRYLQRVEGGQENLSLDSMVKLANKLDVDIIDLFRVPNRSPTKRGRPPKQRR